jgi:hypothetical protein
MKRRHLKLLTDGLDYSQVITNTILTRPLNMEFVPGKFYAHRNFVDVIVKCVDVAYTDRGVNLVVQWYNRGSANKPYQITVERDIIKIDSNLTKNWVEYTVEHLK